MNQTEYKRVGRGYSQCDLILYELQRHKLLGGGGWVSMPMLAMASRAYAVHSRISDLRRRGHRIEQRSTRLPDGTIASEYRLAPEEVAP